MLLLHYDPLKTYDDVYWNDLIGNYLLFSPFPVDRSRIHKPIFNCFVKREDGVAIFGNYSPHEFKKCQDGFTKFTSDYVAYGIKWEMEYIDPLDKCYALLDDIPENQINSMVKWNDGHNCIIECDETEWFLLQCKYPDIIRVY